MKSLEERKKERADRLADSIDKNEPDAVRAPKEAKVAELQAEAKDAAKQPAEVKKAAAAAQWQPNKSATDTGSDKK